MKLAVPCNGCTRQQQGLEARGLSFGKAYIIFYPCRSAILVILYDAVSYYAI